MHNLIHFVFQNEQELDAKLLDKARKEWGGSPASSIASSTASKKKTPVMTTPATASGAKRTVAFDKQSPAEPPSRSATVFRGKGTPGASKKKTTSEISSATSTELQLIGDNMDLKRLVQGAVQGAIKTSMEETIGIIIGKLEHWQWLADS